jgi:uncharacterized UPF0160 family protein
LAEWIKMGAQGAPLRWEKMADGLVGINPNLVTVVKLAGTNVPALWSWAEEWPDRPGRLVFATSQTDISLRRGVIVTHPGVFHADEVYAVAWLIRYVMPEANEIVIVRTRDEKFLAAAKTNRDVYVLDVGGVYEPLNHNYDHHQTGAPCRKSGLPYAALGLVVGSTGVGCGFYYPEATELDEALIQAIDATDTGASEGYQTLRGHPEVRIPARGVSAVIHGFNPTSGVEADFNRAFEQALKFAGQDLDNAVDAAKEAVESRQRVHDAIEATQEPWVVLGRYETVAAEVAATARPDLKYIVFPDETSGTWRILQVPVKPGSHEGRWPLPLHWRGMRGKDLDEASGIAGCVFCHASGFIAGHATKEGAIEMARKAVVS